MEGTSDNFLTQVIDQSMVRGALLYLTLTNMEGLVRDVKAKISLGCSDLEMVACRILQRGSKAKGRTKLWTSGESILSFQTSAQKSHMK